MLRSGGRAPPPALRRLERIADHAKNVAEDAVLLHEAKDIRHAGGG